MISFDFEYYKPTSIAEAVETFHKVHNAVVISGGTEFITFARVNKMHADAIIDLKGIAECHVLEYQGDKLIIGAAVSLNKVTESNLFPLLGQTVKKIADHTSRNKITIGGNMNSQLIYRESILPLLLVDAKVKILKGNREEIMPLNAIFSKELRLDSGSFLLQIHVDKSYVDLPFVSIKKTRFSKVGYPVVSVGALVKDHQIRIAVSGVCEYPFRSTEMETILNDSALSRNERVEKAIAQLPSPIIEDIEGSAEYREFVFKNILLETLEGLKGLEVAK